MPLLLPRARCTRWIGLGFVRRSTVGLPHAGWRRFTRIFMKSLPSRRVDWRLRWGRRGVLVPFGEVHQRSGMGGRGTMLPSVAVLLPNHWREPSAPGQDATTAAWRDRWFVWQDAGLSTILREGSNRPNFRSL